MGDRGRGRRFFLVYCVGMILFYAIFVLTAARPGFPLGGPGDFTPFYTAAHIIRSRNAHRLYDLSLQTQVQQTFVLPHGWVFQNGLLPYVNPPFFAIVFVPLSFLPLAWAFHIWNILNMTLILVSVKLLLRYQQKHSNKEFVKASVVVLAFFPVFEGLYKGQSSFLILSALTFTYLALKRNRNYLAGLSLAMGLVKPHLVILVAALMLYRRQWRTILAFSVTSIVLLIISLITVGIDGIVPYVKLTDQMLNWDSIYVYPEHMFNLRGTVYRFAQLYHTWLETDLSPLVLKAITLLLSVPVLLVILHMWKKPWALTSPEFDLQFGQTMIGSLLLSPHLYGYDPSLLILVGFLLINYFGSRARSTQAHSMIAIGHIAPAVSFPVMGLAAEAQIVTLLLISFMAILQNEALCESGTETRSLKQVDGYEMR